MKDTFYISNLINRILKRYNCVLDPILIGKDRDSDFWLSQHRQDIDCKINVKLNLNKNYIDRNIEYTKDGRLLDETGNSIMMSWEKPIMQFQAKQITRNGGDILNVGFGMGFMDEAIQQNKINSHTIIEIHPKIIEEMNRQGWNRKDNVKILHGDWRDFLFKLPKFDGIYIDIWDDDQLDFINFAPNLLKKDGILSFFNNPTEDLDQDGIPDPHKHVIEKNFNLEMIDFEIPWIDEPKRQTRNSIPYWKKEWKIYKCPLLTLK